MGFIVLLYFFILKNFSTEIGETFDDPIMSERTNKKGKEVSFWCFGEKDKRIKRTESFYLSEDPPMSEHLFTQTFDGPQEDTKKYFDFRIHHTQKIKEYFYPKNSPGWENENFPIFQIFEIEFLKNEFFSL